MLVGQMKVPDKLHTKVMRAKYLRTLAGNKINNAEWHQLSSLVLLHLLGECPDAVAAENLGVDMRVLFLFSRLLEGKKV